MKPAYLKILLLSTIILPISTIYSQPDTLWTRVLGGTETEYARDVQQTEDGGFILLGTKESYGSTFLDVWLVKTTVWGEIEWSKIYGGINQDFGSSLVLTSDGNYVLTGFMENIKNNPDIFLLKINSAGEILWKKTYDGGYSDYGFTVDETSDGGFIIGGCKGDGSTFNGDIWLLKTNTVGDTIWTRQFEGGMINETYENVQYTQDGGYICVSISDRSVPEILSLIKLDSFGRTEWTKTYRDRFSPHYVSIQQTSDTGYIIGANLRGQVGWDIFLIKTDGIGDTLWTKKFGRNDRSEWIYSLNLTTDNGFIIVGGEENEGNSGSSLLLIKTDVFGDTSWILRMNNTNYLRTHGTSIQQTLDGGYIVAADLNVLEDIWLIRLAPDPMSIGVKRTGISEDFNLHQNYPNPFNPSTVISWQLAVGSPVKLTIYNITGQQVATLVNERQAAGSHSVEWDASNHASGVYLYRLQAGEYVETRKMVLMK